MLTKLYTDDRNVPFKDTKLKSLETKSDIDAILAKWGIKKVFWNWDPDNNQVSVAFELPYEKFGGADINPVVRLEPPRIWNKRTRGKKLESVNWRVSMRILHWYIKENLAMSYAMQSQKAVAFLPYIQTPSGRVVKDEILPKLKLLKALPEEIPESEIEIIPPEARKERGL